MANGKNVLHAKLIMRQIRALAYPFPLATVQQRLDHIAELATAAKIDTSPIPMRLNREEPASVVSGDLELEG